MNGHESTNRKKGCRDFMLSDIATLVPEGMGKKKTACCIHDWVTSSSGTQRKPYGSRTRSLERLGVRLGYVQSEKAYLRPSLGTPRRKAMRQSCLEVPLTSHQTGFLGIPRGQDQSPPRQAHTVQVIPDRDYHDECLFFASFSALPSPWWTELNVWTSTELMASLLFFQSHLNTAGNIEARLLKQDRHRVVLGNST